MADVSDKWSCPNCSGLWIRDDQTRDEWFDHLRRAQAAHGQRCKGELQ